MSPNDLWATVYQHLGIDPEDSFDDFQGRPMPILPFGDPSAVARTQALNDAYTTLADPARRRAHDLELTRDTSPPPVRRRAPDIVLAVTPAELIRGGQIPEAAGLASHLRLEAA